jgi:hypothetical protein
MNKKTLMIVGGAVLAGYFLAPQLDGLKLPAGIPNPFAWAGQKGAELAM